LHNAVTALFVRFDWVFNWREKLLGVPLPFSPVRPVALGNDPSAEERVPLDTLADVKGWTRGAYEASLSKAAGYSGSGGEPAPRVIVREGGGECLPTAHGTSTHCVLGCTASKHPSLGRGVFDI
jgi:hypothetical protein